MRDEIRAVLGEERAPARTRSRIHDKIDEARLGGATLEEVAKANGLTVRVVEAVDDRGTAPDGKPVADLPMSAEAAGRPPSAPKSAPTPRR